ncbi:acyltransferase family protein [Hoyosella sp. YIM 151337]|uniref:acyltransferase family protein n=1 Tax=Hoyosella sp. YIM 151337 TaxID=2992742 RepID=UPI002235876B|nr:acyltransferase family protein [Hoyosella sp. YIM 151337]MCW4355884.1 acyltransferase family protein [Hoyosella sp. YIM 151337]
MLASPQKGTALAGSVAVSEPRPSGAGSAPEVAGARLLDDRQPPTRAATHHVAAKGKQPRVQWVDIAKGMTIVLVVLLHAVNMLVTKDLAPDFWRTINGVLQPIRMPLFFVASGLFAQGMIAMTWPKMLRSRVAHLFYLYALWLVVFFAVHNVLPAEVRHDGYATLANIVSGLYIPNSALWFIYGLAVFAVAAKLITKLPVAVQLGVAVALNIYSQYFPVVSWSWNNLAEYFVYFLLGLHLRTVIIRISNRNTLLWISASVALYAGIYYLLKEALPVGVPGLKVVLTTAGLVAGVLVASRLAGTWFGGLLNTVGKNTLPVYLMLDIVIAILVYGLIKVPIVAELPALQLATPALVVIATIMLALYLHKALVAMRLTWLFELPPKLRGTAPKGPALAKSA